MKKFFLFYLFLFTLTAIQAADTVRVKQTRIPILIDRQDNVLFNLRIDAKQSKSLNEVKLHFSDNVDLNEIHEKQIHHIQLWFRRKNQPIMSYC